jgi:chromosome segregation ATPase
VKQLRKDEKMQKQLLKSVVAIVTLAGVLILAVGCQEEKIDAKKTRLIAAENINLKREITHRDQEIQKLKQQHAKELEQQKKLLSDCKQRNENLEKELKKGLEERVTSVTSTIMDQNIKLREQLDNLRKQIEQLEGQIKAEAKPAASQ